MPKCLIALSSGLLIGMSSAGWAQSTTAPVGATAPTGVTSSPLTPTTPNPLLTSGTTAQSSSALPSFLVQSPPETNRLDAAATIGLRLVIGPTSSNTAVLNGDVLSSAAPPAGGLALNALLGQTTSGLATLPPASALSPSFYPARLVGPTSSATFLSQFGGFVGGGTSAGGSSSVATPRITSTSRSTGR